LSVISEEAIRWRTRIVVGERTLPTPIFSGQMVAVTVNPVWKVPPSIVEREILPALKNDPHLLDRLGLKSELRPDGSTRFYQPPGYTNALGQIRFNFPNRFLVYQHDTPEKKLFDRNLRAISHGCVRVDDPLSYAEVLLAIASPGKNFTKARLGSLLGGDEQTIDFVRPIPIHLTYQTAFVDEKGALQIRDDIYGYDARVISLLHRDRPLIEPTRKEESFWQRSFSGVKAVLFGVGRQTQ
jgi:murein L,D-transpeptidase YcbB/YkuD